MSSDFIIGTWDPDEAASAPSWNPYGRMPAASSGVGLVGEGAAEKPPEEALPQISFDVPQMGQCSYCSMYYGGVTLLFC